LNGLACSENVLKRTLKSCLVVASRSWLWPAKAGCPWNERSLILEKVVS